MLSRSNIIDEISKTMFLKASSTVQLFSLLLVAVGSSSGQGRAAAKSPGRATVTVSIVNAGGASLNDLAGSEIAKIISFKREEDGKDLAERFVKGVAKDIPFGTYRIVADGFGDEPFEGVIDVQTPEVFVSVGLAWYGVENDLLFKDVFRGTISGDFKGGHCRASGVYLRWQYDARINPQTGWFDFGAVRPGTYSVVCVIDAKPISFGVVEINAASPPLRFEIPKTGVK